jgi:choline dehydrogenase-like flavoprotein
VAQALDHRAELKLQSSPTAAFLLWLPARLGAPRETGFGLGQLSFTVGLKDGCTAFGSTFATTGLPLSEFARHLPLGRAVGMKVLRHLLSSCVVGNLFLPGDLCDASVRLGAGGELVIRGGYAPAVPALLSQARRQLTGAWRALGAWVLPGSFRSGPPGSDIHYIGTLPMTENPAKGQTSPAGEVQGLPEVYVVDGACMPALPEKSHTLTLMANADRIGRLIAGSIQ